MSEIVVLRLIHIVCGAVWVGAAVFSTFLLVPVLTTLGAGAGPVMEGLRQRGMFFFMPTLALLTIASGLRLMWIVSSGFTSAYFGTASGMTYAASGVAAVVAFGLALATRGPQRPAWISVALTGLLVLAAAGMAVARYMTG